MTPDTFFARLSSVIRAEAHALLALPLGALQPTLFEIGSVILACTGKVVVTGMGKNGHIARRIAATFSCTGTPSCFLHPAESAHGDLGILSANDILLALSNSGKTREIIETVERVQQHYPRVKVITVTGNAASPLGSLGDYILTYGHIEEPCPLGLTPSASLAVMSGLLDGLALAVMEQRGFTRTQFGILHHLGYLGEKIRDQQNDKI
jgi:arabinose-5-phosphate isomerase